MTMSSSCSRVFLSCDPLLDILAEVKSPMVKHQSDPSHYHQQHSDSSLSSSFGSSSLSPSTVATTTTMTLTAAAAPRTTSTTALGDIDPELAQHIEYELGLIKRNNAVGSGTRKNAWGNLSYAELISKAITTSAEQRLTLSEVYDWMIKYVPFFRNKVDRASSAGWKNSIRHNLSLHNRFKRVQSEGTGKSSWWMINPDEKNIPSSVIGSNTSLSKNGTKQGRRRLGQNSKSISSSNTTKRLRNSRSIKSSRTSIANQRQQPETSVSQQISPLDISSIPIYDTQQWTNQLESDNSVNHLYEQDFYSTSINTPLTNSNGNSTGGIPSTYPFDDGTSANSSSNNHNSSDYSYHQFSHHHHHHHHQHHSHPHSHSLYHHHNSNYALAPNNTTYYQQQSMLNDHSTNECHPPMDTYSTNNLLTYSLQAQQHQQQQQQQLLVDPNDDQQLYLRAHSRSSQSSSASLSPPIVTTNNTLGSSSSSTSSYSYSQKGSSLSGGYYHPNSNGTLTLYGHHHSTVETLLRLTGDDEENDGDDDDDDDLSTLVHHHPGLTDDYQLLSHQEPSTSILRTVLKRSTIDMHNQQV